uniref:Calmodulin binding protein n=2 Tax=Solanum tuberosum TaxID=4113 RepID=M1C9R4_SOLTU
MAAHNIGAFEEGSTSSHTETTNPNTPPLITRDVSVSPCKIRRIVVAFLLALWSTFSVEHECNSDLETDQNRNSQKKLDPCESRCLRLKFSHEVAPMVFTGECIFPNGTKLELVDAVTGQQVRHGPPASAQVEIFVLNDDENWTIEELNSHIVMQKGGGTSRCDKNPYLRLEGGVVSVNEIKFKHTAKHMKKSNGVKLRARVVDQPEVIEAVTGPFTVKDKRSKSKKRYPPSPTDDVWRLEHIYKNGAFHKRLTENGIKTVEDFLIELKNNPQRLRHILGKSMSENYWIKATTHAKTCNLDGRKYLYHHLETEQKFTVVFNVAGQVMWLDSGCGLHHFKMLSESHKAYAHKLVETAFTNWENVEKFNNEIPFMDHLSPSLELGCMSRCNLGNLVECQSLEFQNTCGTTESNWWIDSAECSTDRQYESDHEMSLAITSPGHSGWGYLNSPNDITSAAPISDQSGDWEEFIQFLSSDEIEFEDELGQANNDSVAETSSTQLQHGDHLQNLKDSKHVYTNANQQSQMNSVSLVPVGSTCKGKSKKGWIKISSILKWLSLKRFVKLKKLRMTKKRKLIFPQ